MTPNPIPPPLTPSCHRQLLIAVIGDALTFPTTVCEAAAAHITQEFPTRPKITINVEYKWCELKRTYNAIKLYRNCSGTSWDVNSGANIQSASELANWKEWVTTKEGKLMVSFQNQGWNYYCLMHQIAPAGGTQGAGTY
ncbi:hypothetical protein V8B97DRAFT_2041076 [Scleroderma yunnanense]